MIPAQYATYAQQQQQRYQDTLWHVELARAWSAVTRVEDTAARIALARFLGIVAQAAGVISYGMYAPSTVPLTPPSR